MPHARHPILLEKIAPSIFLVKGDNEGRFPFSHSILIRDKITALIDTGCGLERLQRVSEEYRPDIVLNSHTHPDHSAANWLFEGTPVLVPREGFDDSGQLDKLSERFTEPGELARKWRRFAQDTMGLRESRPTQAYSDAGRSNFGAVELVALHTPGHSSDHYCFFEQHRKILFSFDIDLTPFGPWYGCRESSIDQFEASVGRIQALRPRIVVSSHLGIVADHIDQRLDSYLNIISQRDQRIFEFLSQPRGLEEIVDQALIYGAFPYAPELLRFWEKQMVLKHLRRLMDKGLLRGEDGAHVRA